MTEYKSYPKKPLSLSFRESDLRLLKNCSEEMIDSPASVGLLQKLKTRLSIKVDGRIVLLKHEDIYYLKSAGNYIEIYTREKKYLTRETLFNLEIRLRKAGFVRIHRSCMVNIEHVSEVLPWQHGESQVILDNGSKLVLSRTFKPDFDQALDL